MKAPKIVVIGSSNTDMIVKAKQLPVPGETILGENFIINPGGKGANQAIAAKRLGGDITFITKVGNDLFGMQAFEIYRSEYINTGYVFKDPDNPSGVALISVDSMGENCIIVAGGSNMRLSPEDIDKAEEAIKECDLVLIQLEIPLETVEYAVDLAHRHGKKVILNPAPATSLSNDLLKKLYAILPNRIEAQMLSGIQVTDEKSAYEASHAISKKGIDNVVITLGKAGAFVKEDDNYRMIPAKEVETIDTTGAGDVFCGAISVYLSEGYSLMDSVAFANMAASISVTRIGAQSAIPFRREVFL
jgi:ribokinase